MSICTEFDNLLGNESMKRSLTHAVEKGRLGNSLLFAGLEGIGKGAFAQALAEHLICREAPQQRDKIRHGNHPDIHVYRPEGKVGMHSIEALRRFSDEVYLAPYEAKWKFFIIHDAERMLAYSANALLKTFEEPALDAIIVLLSSSPEHLLPTILSRCRRLNFQPLSREEIAKWLIQSKGVDKQQALRAAALAQGSLSKALASLTPEDDRYREALLKVLAEGQFRTYGEMKQWAEIIGEKLEKRKEEIDASMREVLIPKKKEELTATQREALEKEIDGAATLGFLREVDGLMMVILSWFRDMNAVHVGCGTDLTIHADCMEQLQQAIQRGCLRPIEDVQKVVKEAKLAIERFTPLHSVLETVFLRLQFL